QIERSVTVPIRHRDALGLQCSRKARQGDAGAVGTLTELAVSEVEKEVASERRHVRVEGHEQVGPAVAIEVAPRRGLSMSDDVHAERRRDVLESARGVLEQVDVVVGTGRL